MDGWCLMVLVYTVLDDVVDGDGLTKGGSIIAWNSQDIRWEGIRG